MREDLTEKQQAVMDAIVNGLTTTGYSPSYDELMVSCGLKSKNTIRYHLRNLELRGWIRLHPKKARAITVIMDNLGD